MAELTGAQVRMARAAVRWSIADLASNAGVGDSTVKRIEATDGVSSITGGIAQTLASREAGRAAAVAAITKALTGAGVTFLDDDGKGVGIRLKLKASKGRRR
jgi:transcriptional regulator with XRE-family HTH domain